MKLNDLIHHARTGNSIIFDLDNTIYEEKEFLHQVYKYIAKNIFYESGYNDEEVLNFLIKSLKNCGRSSNFSETLKRFPIAKVDEAHLVKMMRAFKPVTLLKKMSWFEEFCTSLPNFEIKIITNGDPRQQKNKIDSLRITNPTFIVFANKTIPKPNPSAFEWLNETKLLKDPVFVGDSEIDKNFAINCNINFVNVKNII